MALLDRLQIPGPKRILALDGGGIRCAITIEFLARIEMELRARHEDPKLKLCDYFDLIGGTGTGAIIAAGLAIGLEARDLRDLYSDLGGLMFDSKRWSARIVAKTKLSAEPPPSRRLEEQLIRVLGNRTLGDAAISTGLCIIARRSDTLSTCLLMNHPLARLYPDHRDRMLVQTIRYSAAATTFVIPEDPDGVGGQIGPAGDGQVGTGNNPAMQLFLVATLQGFPFHWRTGADQLLLVSVGTGTWSRDEPVREVTDRGAGRAAERAISGLMDDVTRQNELILRAISWAPDSWRGDGEDGDVATERIVMEPLLEHVRYNVELEAETLIDLGLSNLASRAASLRGMNKAEHRFDLAEVGRVAATKSVRAAHFPRRFDVSPRATLRAPAGGLPDRAGEVERITKVADPVLRNLLITQFYHETANELARSIGGQNVAWFAFGTWASNVAGTFIRGSAIPAVVRRVAEGRSPLSGALGPAARGFLDRFRETMSEGNATVFGELGPIAARFIPALDAGGGAVESVLDSIAPDPEGRTLLRQAFRYYAAAASAEDPRSRAQLVLAGNLLAVYHEQLRLQPLLQRTLTLPFVGAIDAVSGPIGGILKREWRRFATKFILQYELPGLRLKAGRDVKPAIPAGSFPRDLQRLEHEAASAIWQELCGDAESLARSAASDWSRLPDRMRFIATVFRARQQDSGLLSPPFSRLEMDDLREYRLPRSYVNATP